jgi:hypothetical protein
VSGTVSASPLGEAIFGNLTGRAAAVSLGLNPPLVIPAFTTGTTTGDVSTQSTGTMLQVMIAGGFVTASPTAAVILNLPAPAGGEPGGGGAEPPPAGTAPVPVIATVPQPVTQKAIKLDASQSTNAEGGTLTFLWRSLGNQAAITDATTATPTVQFNAGPRVYVFEVTVTNAQGFSSVATVSINYAGL